MIATLIQDDCSPVWGEEIILVTKRVLTAQIRIVDSNSSQMLSNAFPGKKLESRDAGPVHEIPAKTKGTILKVSTSPKKKNYFPFS